MIGTAKALPWHIDTDAAQINRSLGINVWLPLDSVGSERPSLELVAGSHPVMRRLPLRPDDRAERDDAFAAALSPVIAPWLDPGDAHPWTVHLPPHPVHRDGCSIEPHIL